MKKLLSTLALAAACVAVPAQAAIVLSFTPSSSHVNVGDIVTIDVTLSGLGAEVLSALDINIVFDGNVAVLTAGGFTNVLTVLGAGSAGAFDVEDNLGNLGLQANSVLDDAALAAQQADSFLLGTMLFTGSSDGLSFVTLGPDLDFERNFVGLNFASLEVQVGTACIAVGNASCPAVTVPEPASYGLAALALVAAGVGRRRRRDA